MICKKCGEELFDGAVFCANCGEKAKELHEEKKEERRILSLEEIDEKLKSGELYGVKTPVDFLDQTIDDRPRPKGSRLREDPRPEQYNMDDGLRSDFLKKPQSVPSHLAVTEPIYDDPSVGKYGNARKKKNFSGHENDDVSLQYYDETSVPDEQSDEWERQYMNKEAPEGQWKENIDDRRKDTEKYSAKKSDSSVLVKVLIALAALLVIWYGTLAVLFYTGVTNDFIPVNDIKDYLDARDGEEIGNITANVALGGMVVSNGTDTFFCVDSESGLCALDAQGNIKSVVTDDTAMFINLLGEWLYYVNSEDTFIYSVKTDGSEKKCIVSSKVYSLCAAGNWLYYINGEYALCKVRTDGTGAQQLTQNESVMQDGSFCPVYCDGRIYYVNTSGYICSIKKNGKDALVLNNEISECINVENGKVYYRFVADDSEGICSITTDGEQRTVIVAQNESMLAGMCVSGDWLYYCESNNDLDVTPEQPGYGQKLYKIKTDGSEKEYIADCVKAPLGVTGGYVYGSFVDIRDVDVPLAGERFNLNYMYFGRITTDGTAVKKSIYSGEN